MCRILLTAAVACLLAAGCQPATVELTDAERAAIADSVNAINAEAWDAWREVDLDRALSYFHDSPDYWFALEGQVLRGYAEADSFWRGSFATANRIDITISDSRTMVLTADVVSVLEQGVFSVTDSAGVTSPETAFALSTTWVRRDGEWKVLYGHESWLEPESM
ncbi:MAG: DUF4440 domain-containing protein [Gemmatimonadales bacterium]|nr:DUF4440 domain-containing protein [Gemmatimonadales bacterium]NIN10898.1 DUF4440 domain-containing protein [Gemmatimonadales bacterium]NIN49496.1 DUF4440 domain-containing protein [Gemmatimonadales bacterium]NIP06960.1 DUF4440 domain-containing protein [Gemmatimonadales bacterium]NIR00369.1 DUF4440 domain-containing protein [Gemmatimonadales bacterium]